LIQEFINYKKVATDQFCHHYQAKYKRLCGFKLHRRFVILNIGNTISYQVYRSSKAKIKQ